VIVLGIDPGRDKCGLAVCAAGRVLARAIAPPADVPGLVARWTAEHHVDAIVVGAGTGSSEVLAALRSMPVQDRQPAIALQEEKSTTLAARRRYFEDHPRRGWRRWIPLSLQVPPEAYDDYAAAEIAQRYIESVCSASCEAWGSG
jgi:RNase H-fold protein (predicted Holliday junction resolvase)